MSKLNLKRRAVVRFSECEQVFMRSLDEDGANETPLKHKNRFCHKKYFLTLFKRQPESKRYNK